MTPAEFDAMYRRCYARAKQQARRVLKDRSGLVEDAIQNAVCILYPQLESLEAATADDLFRFAVYYEARTLKRQRDREPTRHLSPRDYEQDAIDRGLHEDPFETIADTERAIEAEEYRQGQAALARLVMPGLTPLERQVLEARIEGLDVEQTATRLGLSTKQVYNARDKAVRRVRELVERRGERA